ncbi:MAG: hypothetical protein Q4C52_10910 [Eubacteriales bacterium]|nr:hypothetical protein [Eubacteriales bacterium]
MLAKLIKYDFKALNRFLIIIHIMLLIMAVLGRVTFVGVIMRNVDAMSEFETIVMTAGILVYALMFMVAVLGTEILVGVHFYRNLFSDEGYLTHTLPVSRGQLLMSKTISGSLWILIDQILLILSGVILVYTKEVAELLVNYKDRIWKAVGFPAGMGYGTILLVLFILCVVSALGNALMIYVSVAVGQLFSNHRVLGAIVVYFGIGIVVGVVSGIFGASIAITDVVQETVSLYQLYVKLFGLSFGIEIAVAVIGYFITYLLMQKKLNLN